jgi:predicted flavoprotein YhiN
VDAREVVHGTLRSKLRSGVYFAGEILDVQGGRGGYNLAWAWASGFVAGLTE